MQFCRHERMAQERLFPFIPKNKVSAETTRAAAQSCSVTARSGFKELGTVTATPSRQTGTSDSSEGSAETLSSMCRGLSR